MPGSCHRHDTLVFQHGTRPGESFRSRDDRKNGAVDIYHLLGIAGGWSAGSLAEGGPVESNERYYRRRAVEERMAAQRAMTDTARAWHAKLAEDFAQRAIASTAISACSQAAVAS